MDENKSPQDFLNEIFEKSQAAAPPVPPPRFEPPGDDPPASPPDRPTEKRGAEAGAKLLPWLGVMLGAALLILGVCLLQLVRMGHRLDELQEAVEAVQSVDSLRKENEQLQEQLDQAEEKSEQLQQALETTSTQLSTRASQKLRLNYLVYLGHFIDSEEYPMAALVAMLSADRYFGEINIDPQYVTLPGEPYYAPPSSIENAQYQAYTRELVDKGYLRLTTDSIIDSSFHLAYTERWDPEQNPDMAALGILWCAMDRYYVLDDPTTAAQYFVDWQEYLMGSPPELYRYLDRLNTASDYLIGLHYQLVYALTDQGYLTWVDGAGEEPGKFEYGPQPVTRPDILVNPPFLHYYYGGVAN